MGERLGYSGIKVELPVETVTHTCYLRLYCQSILETQHRYGKGVDLPLAIMVSNATISRTVNLLRRNSYFGLKESQVTILKQGNVPALKDTDARISMKHPYEIDSKPHGHGDVHSLLHTSKTAERWKSVGIKWIFFFQDTNGLAFFTLPAQLGVSMERALEVNLMTVPRKAHQKIGAIVKMTNKKDRSKCMTINVEYNQLTLLEFTGDSEGDENNPTTGYSPYPGNINQMIFAIGPYVDNLKEMKGGISEFVNPKYSLDNSGTFITPTRLECMMQDYPKILSSGGQVGFTQAPAWLCFSPCKNNVIDAATSKGVPAWAAYTAESEYFFVWAKLLRIAGAKLLRIADVTNSRNNSYVSVSNEDEAILTEITTLERKSSDCPIVECAISALSSPKVVFSPSFLLYPTELRVKIPDPTRIMLTPTSTLCVSGDCSIRSLKLDGSLTVEYNKEDLSTLSSLSSVSSASSSSRCLEIDFGDEFILKNKGHKRREIYTKDESGIIPHEQFQAVRDRWSRVGEIDRMRGYIIEMTECKCVVINDTRGGGGDAAVDVCGTANPTAAATVADSSSTTTSSCCCCSSSSCCCCSSSSSSSSSSIVFDGKGVVVRYASSERNISMTLS